MITPYFGEFLVSPIALELDLNWCTHACAYCFANLNKPDRTADLTGITNLLRDFRERKTLVAQLLQRGYPILFSNKVDPFAASNHQQALVIFRLLRDLGIPVALQTKGARTRDALATFDAALDLIAVPSAWYISIATLDEDIAKRIEPGAPTIAARFAMIERLVSLGHKVTVGMNPLVPEWSPDIPALIDRIKDSGALGIWTEPLHLSSSQTRELSPRELQNLTAPIITRARVKGTHDLDYTHFRNAVLAVQDSGLHLHSVNTPYASGYFDHMAECYPGKTFPTMQGFLNTLHATKSPGDLIYFRDFWTYCAPHLPALDFREVRLKEYIGTTAGRSVKKTHVIPAGLTWQQLLAVIWTDLRMKVAPHQSYAFAPFVGTDDRGSYYFVDDADLRIITLTGDGLPWPRPCHRPAIDTAAA